MTEAQLTKQARGFAVAFGFLFLFGAIWLFAEYYVPLKQFGAAAYAEDQEAIRETIRRLLQLTLQSLPAIALLGALKTAERLFERFGKGDILSDSGARSIGHIGDWLLAAGVLGMLGFDGEASAFAVHFRPDIVLAAVGLSVRFIGHVWAMAARIKAENDQIV